MRVTTAYLPGDEPAAQLPLPLTTEPKPVVRSDRPQTHPRRSPARITAYIAMTSIASRMHPAGGALRRTDPVAYADLVTSMCDQRAALCLADGVPVEHIDRDGYDVSRSGPRKVATR